MTAKAQSDRRDPSTSAKSDPAASHADNTRSESFAEAMLARLASQDKTVQRDAVERIADAVASGDGRCTEALKRALHSPSFRLRWVAAYGLGRIENTTGADVLCEGFSSGDADLRWASARMLARLALKSGRTQALLVRLAGSEEEPVARRMALHSLRYLGASGEEVLSVAEGAAHSSVKLVRLAALLLLAGLNDCSGRAVGVATAMLESDPDPGVRRVAAVALGKIGNGSADVLEALVQTAADRSDRVLARAAESSLRRVGYDGNTGNRDADGTASARIRRRGPRRKTCDRRPAS